jgi:hypothetical protein
VDGFLPIFFLMVVLKIPVGMLLFLVWWAFRAETKPEEAPPDSDDHRFRRFRREPKRPRGPRRGDHGPDALPLPNPRRSLSPAPARGRRSDPQPLRSRTTA